MNQTLEVPVGTRCECRTQNHGHTSGYERDLCVADAVHMVTVSCADAQLRRDDPHGQHDFEVPMCAPCAEYHESKVAK